MSRLVCGDAMFNHRPFEGDGYSLYANVGTSVQYRNLRLLCGGQIGSVELDYGATNVEKTARKQEITNGGTYTIPSAFNTETVTFDIRRFKDDVENESTNYLPATVDIDSSGNSISKIYGTATHIRTDTRAGGVCRVYVRYKAAKNGVQPNVFKLVRTAGPTAPADVEVVKTVIGQAVIEFVTGALSDASAYTFKVVAENDSTTLDLITGLSVTVEATGPTAASTATATAW